MLLLCALLLFTIETQAQDCCCLEAGANACTDVPVSLCALLPGAVCLPPDNERCCCLKDGVETCGVRTGLCAKAGGTCQTVPTGAPTGAPTSGAPTVLPTSAPTGAPTTTGPTCCCISRNPMPGDQCIVLPVITCLLQHACSAGPTTAPLPTAAPVPTPAPGGTCCCTTSGNACVAGVPTAVCTKFGGLCDVATCLCQYDPLLPPLVVPTATCNMPFPSLGGAFGSCITSAPTAPPPTPIVPTAAPTAPPPAPRCCCFTPGALGACQDVPEEQCGKLQGTCRVNSCCCQYAAGQPCVDVDERICLSPHPTFPAPATVGICRPTGCQTPAVTTNIDQFTSGPAAGTLLDTKVGDPVTLVQSFTTGTATEILGASRVFRLITETQIPANTGLWPTSGSSFFVDPARGAVVISSDSGVTPQLVLQYDGDESYGLSTAAGNGLNGGAGIDLTMNGQTNGVTLRLINSNNQVEILLEILSPGGFSSSVKNVPPCPNPTLDPNLGCSSFFPFTNLAAAQRATGVQITITGARNFGPGTDFLLDFVEASCQACGARVTFTDPAQFGTPGATDITLPYTLSAGPRRPFGNNWLFSATKPASALRIFGVDSNAATIANGVHINSFVSTIAGETLEVDFIGAPTASQTLKRVSLRFYMELAAGLNPCSGGATSGTLTARDANGNPLGTAGPLPMPLAANSNTRYEVELSLDVGSDSIRSIVVDYSSALCTGGTGTGFVGFDNLEVAAVNFC